MGVIKSANIRAYSEAQLQILGIVDMISDQALKTKCQQNIDDLMKLSVGEAMREIWAWNSMLLEKNNP